MQIVTSLSFKGQCREAFDTYAAALGGEMSLTIERQPGRAGGSPPKSVNRTNTNEKKPGKPVPNIWHPYHQSQPDAPTPRAASSSRFR